MKKRNFGISMFAAPIMMVCSLLASDTPARAQSADTTVCSNKMLQGHYGFSIDGVILAGPLTLPLRGVAMTHFDGKGNLSQVDQVVTNGVPPVTDWRPGSGPYNVNPDCTGTMQLNFSDGSPSLNLYIAVVKRGTEIHTVVNANAVGSVGIKVD